MSLLEHYGLEAVPVPLDREGMVVEAFAAALASAPALVLLQPRAHNPTGIPMSQERAAQLARLLSRSRHAENTIVIEDDHSGSGSDDTPEVGDDHGGSGSGSDDAPEVDDHGGSGSSGSGSSGSDHGED